MDGSKLDDGRQTCEPEPDVDKQFMRNDLQLAAELGKTLLEVNKELEISLKEYKHKNEEQQREIVHLRKQINAMTEVNDTRLKVYEQLEVGIQDLERSNHRLTLEKSRDKKQIKSLGANIESLEARCEEITQQLEEARQMLNAERRKNEKPLQQQRIVAMTEQIFLPKQWSGIEREGPDLNATPIDNCAFVGAANANSTGLTEIHDGSMSLSEVVSSHSKEIDEVASAAAAAAIKGEDNEELFTLITDLESTRRDFLAEKQRCCELEEQLVSIIQENQTLQSRIAITSTNEEMMSMHDEFSLLDDVRQGQMCSRCLRAMDEQEQASNLDGQSSVAPTEGGVAEDDEQSLLGSEYSAQLANNISVESATKHDANKLLNLNNEGSPNPYRDLVEKYEALLEVQRTSNVRQNGEQLSKEHQSMATVTATPGNQETCIQSVKESNTARGRTSTEFSEAETSSSGFSEETCNKHTQTDERPGYFLCSISNGEECKLSIYDDVSPVDAHFQSRPEYRELFKEIFGVLKKAADNKEDADKSKLMDTAEGTQTNGLETVTTIRPAGDEFSVDFGDDTRSIISSVVSDQSFAMSECVTKLERRTAKKHINECKTQENRLPQINSASVAQLGDLKQIEENGRVLTPVKREPLEFLTVAVGIKKKNRRKNRGLTGQAVRVESPLAQPSPLAHPSPHHNARRTRKDFVPIPPEMLSTELVNGRRRPSDRSGNGTGTEWNGSPMIIYNRNMNASRTRRTGRVIELNGVEFHPNTVSQEFHKLKRLDLSYAEVLRRADACEHQSQPMRVQRMQQSRWNQNKTQSNRR
ncbi:cerebellar degeneration-related protein 2-like [Drosophila nasuta]|uniref:cerebellar degeneration-related protein 2-like n=1 Tax=Drosophila nasuta TaxID=42062 RepID=UPI00295F347F|nr:cerebellar degeneration-related protein 2-like [Drosophila nasuta]XP_060646582.1 cerebellar degeneration-related protein 2-like [Drosophila nasuta]